MAKIFLDAGHGGSDSGAVFGSRREKDDTLRMALAVGKLLAAQNVEVKYARTDDSNPLLRTRTNESNQWGSDYYLSIHRNSFDGTATGNEIWVIRTATDATVSKAAQILATVCQSDGLANRGVKKGAPSYDNFAVNRDTDCASALLEMGFITSDKDNEALDTRFDAIANAIAKSLCGIVGVRYQESAISGDVNGDGKVTTADAREALRAATGLTELSEDAKKAADVNGDGKVTSSDARDILRQAVELD